MNTILFVSEYARTFGVQWESPIPLEGTTGEHIAPAVTMINEIWESVKNEI